ncbi:MAG TPA: serine hydrolase [Mucilaginibacter sp.]|jgi:CubicO group peptidase (beta-lactamase class C family)|nr:serine hydrolase [Mucilaginibacter sp.]
MKKLYLLLIGAIIITSVAEGQTINRSKFINDSLDNYINRALTNWRIPGAAVCIVKDNKVVLMKGYGIKELGLNNKVDENTLFMIGSNTKAFTATALAMLQTQGKLSLDDKVTKYIPEFKLENRFAGEEAIIRDLLCHRIGFRTFQGDFTFYNTDLTRDQVIQKMSLVKAAYPFRTKWGYTNSAFLTAGQIIPKVTGKPWEIYLRENIFAPLGMMNTLALTADITRSLNRTVPHTLVNGQLTAIPYCQIDGLAPAGAISSSVNDMSKWVLAQLNDGKVGQRQVIPATAIEATRQPQDYVGSITYLTGEMSYELYGLGWFLQNYGNRQIVSHTGGVNGYVSSVTMIPKEHLGIIILTNTDVNAFYEALKWDIIDAYLKQPFRDYNQKYLSNFKAHQQAEYLQDKKLKDTLALNHPPALLPAQYTGKYVNELYGTMTVTQGIGNDLEMRFEHHAKMYAHLQPLGGNRFYVTFSDPVLGKAIFPFTVTNGKVTAVRVKVADFVEYDPYDFKKVE